MTEKWKVKPYLSNSEELIMVQGEAAGYGV